MRVHVCAGAHGVQKRALDSLELKSQAVEGCPVVSCPVVSCPVVRGTKLRPSQQANHGSISFTVCGGSVGVGQVHLHVCHVCHGIRVEI